MQKERPDELVKKLRIADGPIALRVALDVQDGRRHFRPRPKHGGRQQPHQFGATLRLESKCSAPVILRAGTGRDPVG